MVRITLSLLLVGLLAVVARAAVAGQTPGVECGDVDGDTCDDCAIVQPPDPANDGIDTDGDGLCNFGDSDDDNDGIPDGHLDLVAGNELTLNRLYLNNGTADPFDGAGGVDITTDSHSTYSVALGRARRRSIGTPRRCPAEPRSTTT